MIGRVIQPTLKELQYMSYTSEDGQTVHFRLMDRIKPRMTGLAIALGFPQHIIANLTTELNPVYYLLGEWLNGRNQEHDPRPLTWGTLITALQHAGLLDEVKILEEHFVAPVAEPMPLARQLHMHSAVGARAEDRIPAAHRINPYQERSVNVQQRNLFSPPVAAAGHHQPLPPADADTIISKLQRFPLHRLDNLAKILLQTSQAEAAKYNCGPRDNKLTALVTTWTARTNEAGRWESLVGALRSCDERQIAKNIARDIGAFHLTTEEDYDPSEALFD